MLLLIETSGRVGRVGVASGTRLIAHRDLDEARRHARDLAPSVAELLRECHCRPCDLKAVMVSLGPGSYTGLRVGVMSAKSLAYAAGCALVGVPTFHVLARQTMTSASRLVAIADAQQDKLYVQEFGRADLDETFVTAGELRVEAGADWARRLDREVLVTGPGLRLADRWLSPETPKTAPDQREPSLAGLLAVGYDLYRRGARDDPARLEPLYLRRSSAEEQWDRRAPSHLNG
jgi:tRNA threonylcarbamoyladenosine biosynthesis protein TsaB